MKTITLTEKEILDITHGLLIAIKECDKHENGSDKILADRLEILLEEKLR